jgi:hypothetical protein
MNPRQTGLAPSFRSTRFAFWRWQGGSDTAAPELSFNEKWGGAKKHTVTVNAVSFHRIRAVSLGVQAEQHHRIIWNRSGPLPGLSRSWPTNDLNKITGTQVLCECGLHLLCVQFCVSLRGLYRLVKRQAD